MRREYDKQGDKSGKNAAPPCVPKFVGYR